MPSHIKLREGCKCQKCAQTRMANAVDLSMGKYLEYKDFELVEVCVVCGHRIVVRITNDLVPG